MTIQKVSLWLVGLLCNMVIAQNTLRIKVLNKEEQKPLLGVTIYIETIQKGSTTDASGIAILEDLPQGQHRLEISFVGFESVVQTIEIPHSNDLLTILLEEKGNHLEEVVLQSTRSSRTIQRTPTRIEFIGGGELKEKGLMSPANIAMVLRESTGIQMQQTSLSSVNSTIRIQGLDGRYTQLLRDGFPLYSGFSSGLSILHIPPLDLKQFEVIKGSSSTLYGGGAISGLVNIISKKPEQDPDLDIMLTQTHALGSTANVFYSQRKQKLGWTLYGSGHYQKAYDPEDDGFSNLPQTKSISVNPKLFYYPTENTTVWVGLNGTYEDRQGGDMTKIEEGENGIHQYSEENLSRRLSSQASFQTQLDTNQSLTIKNSIAFYDRDLQIPDLTFSGTQWNTFTEANYRKQGQRTEWVLGTNLYTTSFDEINSTLERDQKDITYGVFVNNIHDFSDQWILETGLRADYTDNWGFFALPRFSILYKSKGNFTSRFGGGLGYKIPDIFTEEAEFINFENILPIDQNTLEAERSYGVNLDLDYRVQLWNTIDFSINQLFYFTAIDHSLLLSTDDNDVFEFENAEGLVTSRGAETNIKFSYGDLKWFMNYAFIDAKLNYLPDTPQKPLTARHNIGSVIMYESEKWHLGFETYYTGKQLLSNDTKTRDYCVMGLLGMRNFHWGNIFVNFENFTDRRQSRFSSLVLPPHENPTFPEIYAPTDGFIFSIGMILKPFGNNHHH